MEQTLVVARVVMELLPLATIGVERLIAWIQSVRQAAQQSGAWSANDERLFRASLWAKTQDPAYKPDGV